MLYEEFLEGINKGHSESTAHAYKVINQLYMEDKLTTKLEAYGFYSKNRNDFEWIDELDIGHGNNAKKSPELKAVITEDKAKEIINRQFCFEADKIEICGTAYYEASDYNHIAFMVRGYPRVFSNGTLHDIYR